jgi:hypothetical protein
MNEGSGGAVVLGMHRSGTSAVAGFLAKAGFFAGAEDDLLPPAEDNPKGFFERADVNSLNDTMLGEVGGAWDKPPPRALVLDKAPSWQGRARDILARLGTEAGDRPLVLKDPRIGLLLPAWLPALGSRFALVVVDRHPLDVASSVRRRDRRPLYVALALWQVYTSDLLAGLAGQRAMVVRYEDFVADPARQGPLLLERLSEVVTGAGTNAGQAEGFVSRDMRHHRSGAHDAANEQVLTSAQLSLYRWLSALPEGWHEIAAPAELSAEAHEARAAAAEYFDAVADRYGMETAYDTERHRALHFEQATELKDQHIANLEQAISGLRHQQEESSAAAARLKIQVGQLEGDIEALQAELRALKQDGRAAASNLLSAARRGWSARPARQAQSPSGSR